MEKTCSNSSCLIEEEGYCTRMLNEYELCYLGTDFPYAEYEDEPPLQGLTCNKEDCSHKNIDDTCGKQFNQEGVCPGGIDWKLVDNVLRWKVKDPESVKSHPCACDNDCVHRALRLCVLGVEKAGTCKDSGYGDFEPRVAMRQVPPALQKEVIVKYSGDVKEEYLSTTRRWNQHLVDIGIISELDEGLDPDDVILMLAEHMIICESIRPNDHSIRKALMILGDYNNID